MEVINLGGKWKVSLDNESKIDAVLPGTLDENGIGYADKSASKLYQDENYVENASLSGADVIATRFTRKNTFEGVASFSRIFDQNLSQDKRVFLEAERARILKLYIDEKGVKALRGTLSTPYCFEVTGLINKGSEIKILSDNSYEGLPHDNIVYSSAATDETQTNWNGITGYLRLRLEDHSFIEKINVYVGEKAHIRAYISSDRDAEAKLVLQSVAFLQKIEKAVSLKPGTTEVEISDIALNNVQKWDEYAGNLYILEADLETEAYKAHYETRFGVRDFGDDGKGHLSLNGRRIFLRSEANCCVFPETGHPPVTVTEWKKVIKIYMGYGINCLRFHSHCPPEAAFEAADELGILMQPELSHWNPVDAFSDPIAQRYYEKEAMEILYQYASHPSFVMMTFGTELQANDTGMEYMHGLMDRCRSYDSTRLYAIASNAFYGEKGCDAQSDFYTSMMYKNRPLRATFDGMRGYLNNEYPNAKRNYDDSMKDLRKDFKKPVFSFEVGQFEVLPDFDEIAEFKGISRPDNYSLIQNKVIENGLEDSWKKRVEATGELSLLCYREEVEGALRTEDFSGISLLGLQDFPGQGTALVGMLNSHLQSKPYSFAKPERFKAFFRRVLPMVYLDKYTYTRGERIQAKVKLANYSASEVSAKLEYKLVSKNADKEICLFSHESDKTIDCPCGQLSDIGEIDISLESINSNQQLEIQVLFGENSNSYPVWVYAENGKTVNKTQEIYETKELNDEAIAVLEQGGVVYLSPDSTKDMLPNSIKSTFSTDFWSVGTFASQEGSMGLLIDDAHPIFKDFPTDCHTNYQWWIMASQRAVILPKEIKSIVTVMDSYAYMRNMALLLEFKCLKGKVLFSTMGLQNLQQYPECRALQASIYRYMDSEDFTPSQEIDVDCLKKVLSEK